jgi:hypothetical protein
MGTVRGICGRCRKLSVCSGMVIPQIACACFEPNMVQPELAVHGENGNCNCKRDGQGRCIVPKPHELTAAVAHPPAEAAAVPRDEPVGDLRNSCTYQPVCGDGSGCAPPPNDCPGYAPAPPAVASSLRPPAGSTNVIIKPCRVCNQAKVASNGMCKSCWATYQHQQRQRKRTVRYARLFKVTTDHVCDFAFGGVCQGAVLEWTCSDCGEVRRRCDTHQGGRALSIARSQHIRRSHPGKHK